MPSIESAVVHVVAKTSGDLAQRLTESLDLRSAAVPRSAAERLLRKLGPDAGKLLGYLESREFAAVVAQVCVHEEAASKPQLHEGLRLAPSFAHGDE